jgi:uncharacterized surface protein with fasciclin (FAS1) repeats
MLKNCIHFNIHSFISVPSTLFGPANEAFDALSEEQVTKLQDLILLPDILKYHSGLGEFFSQNFVNDQLFRTFLEGNWIRTNICEKTGVS